MIRATASTTGQVIAALAGLVFLLVGIGGFIPGLTARAGQLPVAGPGSMAMLLGVFMVSILHDMVRLLFGVASLVSWPAPLVAHAHASSAARVI